jgi:hypothetical protein
MTFNQLQKIFSQHYYMEHEPDFLKIIVGTIIANRLDGESVWLLVLAPPSSGKAIISTLSKSQEVVMVSSLTANSLMSGARKQDTVDGKDASLLPKLHGKVMVVKDASTISDMNPSDMEEKHTGLGRVRCASKFGIIMAGTPDFERSRALEGNLGERFIYFRPTIESDSKRIWHTIKRSVGKQKKYNEMCNAMIEFLAICGEPGKVSCPDEIFDHCQKLAFLRAGFSYDRYTKEIDFGPIVENPYRVAQQFSALYSGIKHIDNHRNAMTIIRRMIVDSIPFQRLQAIEYILNCNNGIGPTRSSFRDHIGWGKNKSLQIINELKVLKVVEDSGVSSVGSIIKVSKGFTGLFYLSPRK